MFELHPMPGYQLPCYELYMIFTMYLSLNEPIPFINEILIIIIYLWMCVLLKIIIMHCTWLFAFHQFHWWYIRVFHYHITLNHMVSAIPQIKWYQESILCMCSAKESWCYISSFIGWVFKQKIPWILLCMHPAKERLRYMYHRLSFAGRIPKMIPCYHLISQYFVLHLT